MKKFGLYLCFLILIFVINHEALSQNFQYKNEINATIKEQVPYYKKQIKSTVKEIKNENNLLIKRTLVEQGINSVVLEFYIKLESITNKYFDIDKDIPHTDWYGDVKNVITPYLEDNDVNMSKINSFLKYANKKQNFVEKIVD